MPGDQEHIVALNADHSNVCKFGESSTDRQNYELVEQNIRDLYEEALSKSIPVVPGAQYANYRRNDDEMRLDARLARLRDNSGRDFMCNSRPSSCIRTKQPEQLLFLSVHFPSVLSVALLTVSHCVVFHTKRTNRDKCWTDD